MAHCRRRSWRCSSSSTSASAGAARRRRTSAWRWSSAISPICSPVRPKGSHVADARRDHAPGARGLVAVRRGHAVAYHGDRAGRGAGARPVALAISSSLYGGDATLALLPGADDGADHGAGGAAGVSLADSRSIGAWRPIRRGCGWGDGRMTVDSQLTPRAKGTLAPSRRFARAQVAVAGAFLVLIGRLYQLQVMSGDYYMRKSADNFVKELELPATRGQIRDRKGRDPRRQPTRLQRLHHAALLQHRCVHQAQEVSRALATSRRPLLEVKIVGEEGARSLPPAARLRGHYARSTGITRVGKE